jgi:hypothetical protein
MSKEDQKTCIQKYWIDEINFMLEISKSIYKKPEILAHSNITQIKCNYNNPK